MSHTVSKRARPLLPWKDNSIHFNVKEFCPIFSDRSDSSCWLDVTVTISTRATHNTDFQNKTREALTSDIGCVGRSASSSPWIWANLKHKLLPKMFVTEVSFRVHTAMFTRVLTILWALEFHQPKSGFVCACLCVWLLAYNSTATETKISPHPGPHRHHPAEPNQTEPICAANQWTGVSCADVVR